MRTRRTFLALAGALVASAVCRPALSQVGERAARLVVGFPPGGIPDVVARLLAERLQGGYASAVIVENRPGAAGRIAVEAVKTARGDGNTMLVTPNPMITLYPHVYQALSYDPLRDLAAVSTLCSYPLAFSTGPAVPAEVRGIADFVQWASRQGAAVPYASSAPGSTLHFAGMLFARAAGIELTHIPYKGGVAAIQDVLGGRLPLVITSLPVAVPHARSGRLRTLAVTGRERSAALPEVPTLGESGYAGLDLKDWIGIFLPASASPETVARLNAAVREALKSSELSSALAKQMVEPGGTTPAEAAALVQAEHRMWRPIVKASGFVADD
jgi:tripartite-type tricarboxylate transporter receptor subunit TctC